MWASRREEALRRAIELVEFAELARADAREARLAAEQPDVDNESRASMTESAAEMDVAAEQYQRVSDTYLAMFQGTHSAEQYDDDADGF
jgi:hypothetical protein